MKTKKWLQILAIGLFVLIADKLGGLNPIKSGFSRLSGATRAKIYQQKTMSSDGEEKLKRELNSCQMRVLELEEENFRARKLLGAAIKPKTKLALGKVIGISGSQITVFANGEDGIKTGASVVTGRILLGRVRSTVGQMAKADFLNALGFKIPVKIWLTRQLAEKKDPHLAEGILVGDGKNLVVKEILATEKVATGDWAGAVVESGDVFLIGKVKKVFPSEDKVFQEVAVDWLANPRELLTVGIIK